MHVHNADPAKGPVCTSQATNEIMTALGFPVEQVNHGIITSPGMKSNDAIMAAWRAGKVRICTVDPGERRRTH